MKIFVSVQVAAAVFFCVYRFGEGAVFSETVDDHPSLDEGYVSVSFFSAFFSVMPLACLGLGYPPVLFPVFGFAFCFFSASASFLICSSFRDIFFGSSCHGILFQPFMLGAFGCSMSKKGKHVPVFLAYIFAT